MRAKDVMSRRVVAVESWLTLAELAGIFEKKAISGAPVVDESGTVLGVVSLTDLVRARGEASPGVPVYHRELDDSARASGFHLEEMDQRRVEEIMTPGAIALDVETPVETVAKVMLDSRIHRVLVTKGGRLAGIVTTMDMLRAVTALARRASRERVQSR